MDIDKKDKNKISFSIFLTSILTFFALGVFLAEPIGDLYVKNIKNSDINVYKIDKKEQDLDLIKFWETYNLLQEKYYSLEGIKKADLVDGAIAGMVNAIGDKHSEFMNSVEAKSFNDALSGDFEGIGAVVEKTSIGVRIDRILKGSPAKQYGLLKDDIIIEANGVKLEDLNIGEAVDKIKGPAGTIVLLKILRIGEKEALEKEIIRAKIKVPTIETKTFEDDENIGYISLNIYGETSATEFKKALEEFKDKSGIIIDLRDNGGGYLQAAVEILSNFIDDGKEVVQVRGKNILDNTSYKSVSIGEKYKRKIVILINGNTASASEITAGALKDYNLSILVGEKSYGKGSVQEPFSFSDGSQLKFTIAKWFTPNGINIDKDGINPDIEVSFKKEDYDLDECKTVGKCDKDLKQEDFEFFDRQLDIAKKVLKSFIEFKSPNIAISKFLEINTEYKKEITNTGSLEK